MARPLPVPLLLWGAAWRSVVETYEGASRLRCAYQDFCSSNGCEIAIMIMVS